MLSFYSFIVSNIIIASVVINSVKNSNNKENSVWSASCSKRRPADPNAIQFDPIEIKVDREFQL